MTEIIMHPLNGDEFRVENPLASLHRSIFFPVRADITFGPQAPLSEIAFEPVKNVEFRHMGTHRATGLPYYEEQPSALHPTEDNNHE